MPVPVGTRRFAFADKLPKTLSAIGSIRRRHSRTSSAIQYRRIARSVCQGERRRSVRKTSRFSAVKEAALIGNGGRSRSSLSPPLGPPASGPRGHPAVPPGRRHPPHHRDGGRPEGGGRAVPRQGEERKVGPRRGRKSRPEGRPTPPPPTCGGGATLCGWPPRGRSRRATPAPAARPPPRSSGRPG